MKKIILSIAIALFGLSSTSFAYDSGNVNKQALKTFNREFSTAREIVWGTDGRYSRASFNMNGQVLAAWFNEGGDLVAVTRNITADQLPMNLYTDLKKNFGSYWISDLFELASNGESMYYLTIENADYKIVLKSVDTNYWEVFEKTRKENL